MNMKYNIISHSTTIMKFFLNSGRAEVPHTRSAESNEGKVSERERRDFIDCVYYRADSLKAERERKRKEVHATKIMSAVFLAK